MPTWKINCTVSFAVEAENKTEAIHELAKSSFKLTNNVKLISNLYPQTINEILPIIKVHGIAIPENYREVFTIMEMRIIAECVEPIDLNKVITKMLSEHYYPLATPNFMLEVMKKLVEKGYMVFIND